MAVERQARGALLNAPGEAISIEPIVLDPPGPGEVQVRVQASGVCHSDLHLMETDGWVYPFPILPGHEASTSTSGSSSGRGASGQPTSSTRPSKIRSRPCGS